MKRRDVLWIMVGTGAMLEMGSVSGASVDRVVVQWGSPSPNTGYVPLFAAIEAGFFRDEGIEVEVRHSRGAPLAAQMVSSNDAEIGNFSYEPVIQGYSKGLKGKFYYQVYNKTIYWIGVPDDSSIKSVEELRGKRIGVASLSSAAVPAAKAILRENNVDISSVKFVPVGVGGQVVSAVLKGEVDAVAYWDSAYGALEVLGLSLRFFEHSKLKVLGNGGLFTSNSTLEKRRDDLVRYGRAFARGTKLLFDDPERAIELYWKHNPAGRRSGDVKDAMEKTLQEMKYLMRDIKPRADDGGELKYGLIKLDEIQEFINLFGKEVGLDKYPESSEIATNELVNEINTF